jgi:hypothetical protein
VYLFVTLGVAVVGTFGASQLLYYVVGRLLGVERPGGVGGNLLQAAAGPASIVLVYGVAWLYQRVSLRQQARAFEEAPRQAGIRCCTSRASPGCGARDGRAGNRYSRG